MYGDTLEAFARYAGATGAEVLICGDEREAATAIAKVANGGNEQLRCTPAVQNHYPGIYHVLEKMGPAISIAGEIAGQEPDRSALASTLADGIGVVAANGAVAETGSLVLADDALAPRLLSMLSDVCVALLSATTIVPSLDEAATLIADLERSGHRYISLVTGPSRTADIERVLTIGVQGPKALHIIVLAGKGGTDAA